MPQEIIVAKKNIIRVVEAGPVGPPGDKGNQGEDGIPGESGVAVNTDGNPGGTLYIGATDPRDMDAPPTLEIGDLWLDKYNRRWNGTEWVALSYFLTDVKTVMFYSVEEAQMWTVPENVYYIDCDLTGASGIDGRSGLGGVIKATVPVIPGDVLGIYVGAPNDGGLGGWNGGGNAVMPHGSGGCGATDIRINGDSLNHRVLVAGGGGGGAYNGAGGVGGGLVGGQGNGTYPGLGGTQIAPGGSKRPPGGDIPAAFGRGGDSVNGGAGGGGYFGGGGGGTSSGYQYGGGGGSAFSSPTNESMETVAGGATSVARAIIRYVGGESES